MTRLDYRVINKIQRLKYDISYIDLSDKPEDFLKISPFGKVPVLKVADKVIFESAVINEYIDETAPGESLHPSDPLEKAYHRAWIEFSSALVMSGYPYYMAKDEQTLLSCADDVREKLKCLEERVSVPWFSGQQFCLVD